MKFLELLKNRKGQIALAIIAILIVAYLTRKRWYYSKGITINNINKETKTVDVVFNYDGVLKELNYYKADAFTDDIITASKFYDKTEKSNFSFSVDNWKGVTYFTIEDHSKDPKKGENAIVSEIGIDWSKTAVPFDNTVAANAEYIASTKPDSGSTSRFKKQI